MLAIWQSLISVYLDGKVEDFASSGVNQDQVCHLPFLRGTSLTCSEKNTSNTSETFGSIRHMI